MKHIIRRITKEIVIWFTKFGSRKLEWMISVYTIYFGVLLIIPGDSMGGPNFVKPLQWLPEEQWGFMYTAVGILHAVALHINGRAAWTPFVRAIMLLINSQVFLWLSAGLAQTNPMGTGPHTYGFLAIGFCGVALWSACIDCGREIKTWQCRKKREVTRDGY